MKTDKVIDELTRHGLLDVAEIRRFRAYRSLPAGQFEVILEVFDYGSRRSPAAARFGCTVYSAAGERLLDGNDASDLVGALVGVLGHELDKQLEARADDYPSL